MPEVTVPGTTTVLDIMGASDIVEETRTRGWPKFHVNYLAKLVDKNQFPAPWITLSARHGWLREDYEAWWAERVNGITEKALEETVAVLGNLQGKDLDRALAALKKRIQEGAPAA